MTLVVALQAYGAANAQHRVEHTLQYPGVSYVEMSAAPHAHADDHAQDHDHDHEAPAPDPAPNEGPVADLSETPDGDVPLPHHHHGAGDIHLALAAPAHPVAEAVKADARLGPTPGRLPPGVYRDGPSHPPKQRA